MFLYEAKLIFTLKYMKIMLAHLPSATSNLVKWHLGPSITPWSIIGFVNTSAPVISKSSKSQLDLSLTIYSLKASAESPSNACERSLWDGSPAPSFERECSRYLRTYLVWSATLGTPTTILQKWPLKEVNHFLIVSDPLQWSFWSSRTSTSHSEENLDTCRSYFLA